MEIGEQLRKVRRFRGLSLEELAQRSGVSRATLSSWETGRFEPKASTLKKVLDVLGITHEQLYQDFDQVFLAEVMEKYNTDSKDIEVVLTANPNLSPADIEAIMMLVQGLEKKGREAEDKDV